MICGPISLERATGIPREETILRIRAYREQRGQRISLKGGTNLRELRHVARLYGWRIRTVFEWKRVKLACLAKRIKQGRWIFRQRDHFFGVRSARELRRASRDEPNARPIVSAYRVCRWRDLTFRATLTKVL